MDENRNLQDLAKKTEGYYSYSRSEMMAYIPRTAKRVLEVGCGEGHFGQGLRNELGAEVWGIELDENAGTSACGKLDKVIIGDATKKLAETPTQYFDCVVFNDVLEHLVDPFSMLLKTKEKLTPDGVVVCSIPNVRYFYVLRDLIIKKQWEYVDLGVLDKTHLRFFTLKSIKCMFNDLGYDIQTIKGIGPIKSFTFALLNFLVFGWLSDARYKQFACVVKPKN